jgi:FixJ family two-component response regulator
MIAMDRIVFVVNGEAGVRADLCQLIGSTGLRVLPFVSGAEYLAFSKPDLPACVILDVSLPDMSGLDLQQRIAATDPPIVFVTGRADVSCSVRAIKAGAVDFLTIPYQAGDLVEAIHAAIARDRTARENRARLDELRQRYACLTPRERQVLPLVVSGRLNKLAAAELGISEITVKAHRGKVMQKMKARSLADLIRIAGSLQVSCPDEPEDRAGDCVVPRRRSTVHDAYVA